MDLLDVPAPTVARLRRPGWRDARLLTGLVLIAVAVALGSWVVATAQRTIPVYVARGELVPGEAVAAADLAVAEVRLSDAALEHYVRADVPFPDDSVVVRVVDDGELVARSALGDAGDLALRSVVVPLDEAVPSGLVAGALVDLWHRPNEGESKPLTTSAIVAEVTQKGGTSSGKQGVLVLVPSDVLAAVLDALAAGEVDVVPVPGTGR